MQGGEKKLEAPRQPKRPPAYGEEADESPRLIEQEPAEVEREVPSKENEPVEREEPPEKPAPPLFEE